MHIIYWTCQVQPNGTEWWSEGGTWLQLIAWYESASIIQLASLGWRRSERVKVDWINQGICTCTHFDKNWRSITYEFCLHRSVKSISHLFSTCSFDFSHFPPLLTCPFFFRNRRKDCANALGWRCIAFCDSYVGQNLGQPTLSTFQLNRILVVDLDFAC